MTYVPLHVHGEHSTLDGLSKSEDLARIAVEQKIPALALTDHGHLAGLATHYKQCKQAGIGAVLGMEAYFLPKKSADKKRPKYQHVILLARKEKGFRVLCELATEANRNFYYSSVLHRNSLSALGKDAKHLTVLSGCLAGPLSVAAQIGYDALREELEWWKKIFPHFYIEIQDHGIPLDKKVNSALLKVSRQSGTPFCVTGDSHYSVESDACHHDALLAIQTKSQLDDEDRFRFDGQGYWLMSSQEMKKNFSSYPTEVWKEGSSSTINIAKECIGEIPEWETKTWHIPEIPGVHDAYGLTQKKAVRALKALIKKDPKRYGKKYILRLEEELGVIKDMGVAAFILVAEDAIAYAKEVGIIIGPGRGSVVGCLVAYLLGITKVDPVRYNLRFDRFLNPERPRMPDIDTDFEAARRDEVFAYVRQRYGDDNVLSVCTFQRMKARRAFRSLAKSHGIPYEEVNEISKHLSDDDDLEDHIPEDMLAQYPDLLDQIKALSGLKCGFGSHPAGVIIASPDYGLTKKVPQMWLASSKRWVAQYDLDSFEAMGLLKQDFLGLTTLNRIADCLAMLDDPPNTDHWVPDEMPWDADVYQMLAEGRTKGVFQFEGPSATDGAKRLGIRCFKDMVDALALFRKGPLLSGCTDEYLRALQSGKPDYLHPMLEPVLHKTFGQIVFQEDIMEIGEKIAGFGPGENDDLLKATAKKKADLMASIGPRFVQACRGNGLPESAAHALWDQVKESSWYLFNQAHSTGYAMTAYITASLKVQYPLEYYCAMIRTEDDKDKKIEYLREAVGAGFRVLRPHIHKSDARATPDHNLNGIRFGLADVKGIGEKLATRLIKYRSDQKFRSVVTIQDIVNNSKALHALVMTGALRPLGAQAHPEYDEALLGWRFIDPMVTIRPQLERHHNPPHTICGELVSTNKGTTRKGDPMCTWKVRWSPSEEWAVKLWSNSQSLYSVPKGSIVKVSGQYQEKYNSLAVRNPDNVRIIKRNQNGSKKTIRRLSRSSN